MEINSNLFSRYLVVMEKTCSYPKKQGWLLSQDVLPGKSPFGKDTSKVVKVQLVKKLMVEEICRFSHYLLNGYILRMAPGPRIPVTTKIITFLGGNPSKPKRKMPLLLGRGHTQDIYIYIILY